MLAQIAADVAAGTDIVVIIQCAVAGGMPLEKAVEAIVNPGCADPGRVVYLAIAANYSAESVVKGAIAAVSRMGLSESDFQAALALVFSAALQAGAPHNQVILGAVNDGLSNTAIANALAMSKPAPVYSYTAPAPTGFATSGPYWWMYVASPSHQASPYTP